MSPGPLARVELACRDTGRQREFYGRILGLRFDYLSNLGAYVAFTGGEAQELSSGEISRTEIPVEKTNGPVLLISAGDDALWPSERLSRVAYERLSNSRRTHEDETVTC